MAKRNIKFDLDFEQKDILPKFSIKQFDNALISVSTFLNGKPLNPSGNTCKLYVSAGNDVFLQESNIRTLENLVEIDLDKNVISLDGKAFGELELKDSNGTFTSATFIFDIDSKVGEGSTLPNGVEGFITKHERLIREFKNEINPKIDVINNSISDINIKDNEQDSRLGQIENKNIEQDTRLKDVEYKNKVQDVYVKGLFNENNDKRLSIEGKGNSIKLEGSKKGLVTVDKVVGDTLVNLVNVKTPFTWKGTTRSKTLTNDISVFKPNTTYTVMFNVSNLNVGSSVNGLYVEIQCSALGRSGGSVATVTGNGTWIGTFQTFNHDDSVSVKNLIAKGATSQWTSEDTEKTMTLSDFVILEGDYTNKPIPQEYFTGLQSTFENKLITQEMVDNEEELAENLGKYKCDVKVRGKNLFDGELELGSLGNNGQNIVSTKCVRCVNYIPINPNKEYVISSNLNYSYIIIFYDKDFNVLNPSGNLSNIPDNTSYMRFRTSEGKTENDLNVNIQLEEGTQATPYEPYFERNQTVYLNSPLLKGDELVCKEDGLYHYHKMGVKIFDGSKDESWYKNVVLTNTIMWGLSNFGKPHAEGYCDKIPYITGSSEEDVFHCRTSGGGAFLTWVEKTKTPTEDLSGYRMWLQNNPIKVVYELAEPYYEKISDDQIILEIPNGATLTFDSAVPVANTSATYTGNVPSVYGLEETGEQNTNDIAVTQTAVDFLLMSSMGEVMMMSFKNNTKGGNNMGAYFASRIMKKTLKYEDVIRKYPEFKEDIDFILRSEGYGDLIVEL